MEPTSLPLAPASLPLAPTSLPSYYRFDPTDYEIIQYLYHKVHALPLPSSAVIECDLYDQSDTWKRHFQDQGENTLFFFTKLKKKSEKGSRVERVTGSGTWRSQFDKDLFCDGDTRKLIGHKRNFTFVPNKNNIQEKGKWVMHEYRLHECPPMSQKNDYVLCRIKKKATKEKRKGRNLITSNNITITENTGCGDHRMISGLQQGQYGATKAIAGATEGVNENYRMMALFEEETNYFDPNQCVTMEDLDWIRKICDSSPHHS